MASRQGPTTSEHPDFGSVHDGHTEGSLHYGGARNVAQMRRRGLEGRALDVNDHDPIDNRFRNEREALTFLYFKLLRAADKFDWPLDEMFFNGFGYMKEGSPDEEPNHPIGGHDGHLHIGVTSATF